MNDDYRLANIAKLYKYANTYLCMSRDQTCKNPDDIRAARCSVILFWIIEYTTRVIDNIEKNEVYRLGWHELEDYYYMVMGSRDTTNPVLGDRFIDYLTNRMVIAINHCRAMMQPY